VGPKSWSCESSNEPVEIVGGARRTPRAQSAAACMPGSDRGGVWVHRRLGNRSAAVLHEAVSRLRAPLDRPVSRLRFVTDVGLLHLANGVLAVWAIRDIRLRRAVGVTWVAFAVPHLLYHAIHTAGMDALAATTCLVALAISALAGVLLIVGVPPQVEALE